MSTVFECLVELFILFFRWPFSHPTVAIVSVMTAGATGMVMASFTNEARIAQGKP